MQILSDNAKNHLLSLVRQPHGEVEDSTIAEAELRAQGLLTGDGLTPAGQIKASDLATEARRG